jgi:branched-chain amino acid transport system substrate-binding protein
VVEPPHPIVIGASLSLSGSNARSGKEVLQAFQLWLKDVNAAGGLLGRRVELQVYDDETKPEAAARLYEQLILVDNVDLVLGPYGSPVTAAVSVVTERHQVPMIATGASATAIWERGFRYVFEVYTAESRFMEGAIELAGEMGAKTVAVIHENTAFGRSVAAGSTELAKQKGIQVVLLEQYAQNTRDFRPLVLKIKAASPDILIGGAYLPDAVSFTRQARELDLNLKMMAFAAGSALPEFGAELREDAHSILGVTQWEPSLPLPGVAEFVRKYQDAYGYEPGHHAAGGYGSAQLLEAAVRKAGSLDRGKLRDTLLTLEARTVFGDYKVNDKGLQTAKPGYTTQWQNGKREIIWPKEAATAAPIWPAPHWKDRK